MHLLGLDRSVLPRCNARTGSEPSSREPYAHSLLGHSSQQVTTEIYTHLFPEEFDGLKDRLDKIYGRIFAAASADLQQQKAFGTSVDNVAAEVGFPPYRRSESCDVEKALSGIEGGYGAARPLCPFVVAPLAAASRALAGGRMRFPCGRSFRAGTSAVRSIPRVGKNVGKDRSCRPTTRTAPTAFVRQTEPIGAQWVGMRRYTAVS